jgi:hypothetical protein
VDCSQGDSECRQAARISLRIADWRVDLVAVYRQTEGFILLALRQNDPMYNMDSAGLGRMKSECRLPLNSVRCANDLADNKTINVRIT